MQDQLPARYQQVGYDTDHARVQRRRHDPRYDFIEAIAALLVGVLEGHTAPPNSRRRRSSSSFSLLPPSPDGLAAFQRENEHEEADALVENAENEGHQGPAVGHRRHGDGAATGAQEDQEVGEGEQEKEPAGDQEQEAVAADEEKFERERRRDVRFTEQQSLSQPQGQIDHDGDQDADDPLQRFENVARLLRFQHHVDHLS